MKKKEAIAILEQMIQSKKILNAGRKGMVNVFSDDARKEITIKGMERVNGEIRALEMGIKALTSKKKAKKKIEELELLLNDEMQISTKILRYEKKLANELEEKETEASEKEQRIIQLEEELSKIRTGGWTEFSEYMPLDKCTLIIKHKIFGYVVFGRFLGKEDERIKFEDLSKRCFNIDPNKFVWQLAANESKELLRDIYY